MSKVKVKYKMDRLKVYLISKKYSQYLWAKKKILEGYVPEFYCSDSDMITGLVRGENDVYAVCIDRVFKIFSCSCWGNKSHKTACKHIIFLILYSILRGDLTSDEAYEVLSKGEHHLQKLKNGLDLFSLLKIIRGD